MVIFDISKTYINPREYKVKMEKIISAKISVIIPVYNVEKYLSQCLENIIHQTYTNLEIICINDGSADNSKNILKDYAKIDKRIRIIEKENGGISSARNVGIKEATGDYIHFIDSDDYIPLNYYEKMIKASDNTNADIVCSGFYFEECKEMSVYYKDTFILTNLYDKLYKTFINYFNYVWRYLIKTSFIKENNFYFINGKVYEDIGYTLELLIKANKVVIVPKVQYFYRYRKDSIVHNKKYNNDLTEAFLRYNKVLEKYDIKLLNLVLSIKYYKLFSKFTILKKFIYLNKTKYILLGFIQWKVVHAKLTNK